jgi:mevalonate kinase
VILFGEHAVVYGQPAVAAAVGLLTECRARRCAPERLELVVRAEGDACAELGRWSDAGVRNVLEGWSAYWEARGRAPTLDAAAMEWVRELAACRLQSVEVVLLFLAARFLGPAALGWRVSVGTELPMGCGLGASASLACCLAALFQGIARRAAGGPSTLAAADQAEVCAAALDAERHFHSRPSGVDNTVVTYGGCLAFERAPAPRHWPVRAPPGRLLLVDCGARAATKTMVERFAARRDAERDRVEAAISAMGGIAREAIRVLDSGGKDTDTDTLPALGALMARNHRHLAACGVSCAELDRAVACCARHDVVAKLTGGGGGGCALALLPAGAAPAALLAELAAAGFTAHFTDVTATAVSFAEVEQRCATADSLPGCAAGGKKAPASCDPPSAVP